MDRLREERWPPVVTVAQSRADCGPSNRNRLRQRAVAKGEVWLLPRRLFGSRLRAHSLRNPAASKTLEKAWPGITRMNRTGAILLTGLFIAGLWSLLRGFAGVWGLSTRR